MEEITEEIEQESKVTIIGRKVCDIAIKTCDVIIYMILGMLVVVIIMFIMGYQPK